MTVCESPVRSAKSPTYDGQRGKYCSNGIIGYGLINLAVGVPPFVVPEYMLVSWLVQGELFMPTSFLKFAVDIDGGSSAV